MSDRYNVSVEFDRFSKKFENVAKPRFESYGNATILAVDAGNRTVCFNFAHVQFYSMEEDK